ncbi:MAG: fructose-6-phosphate aldolase [Elusimicrobia bacterium CG1_02_37_114]|nr:MAG: fructose-6-phosphate aldolase [Elusimicrobia bacterium CG1_02_37_114]PIV53737.1 MAG: fructose-6-phosphate aldolase [Elusimicrobia bacterium CG02_land_8_20_14_3_00_37_13]PIZ13524.1 MAG: fructose-6-phosphate aldolase [Elusimicrobia bacterium CG_4_10_14_0_8_um_filter_37_32]
MKLFIDSADVDEIRTVFSWGLLDGVTTNPTLIAKQNKNPEELLKQISKVADLPVLAEPVSTDYEGIIKESNKLTRISKNIVAKIAMTMEGVRAVSTLSKKGIKTALTLIFSPAQAILAAKAGADWICPFVGRLDDAGERGLDLVKNIVQIYKIHNYKTKVLVVSVRNSDHISFSALYGADAVSVPFKVIQQMSQHSLTDAGIKKFLEDWSKSGETK